LIICPELSVIGAANCGCRCSVEWVLSGMIEGQKQRVAKLLLVKINRDKTCIKCFVCQVVEYTD